MRCLEQTQPVHAEKCSFEMIDTLAPRRGLAEPRTDVDQSLPRTLARGPRILRLIFQARTGILHLNPGESVNSRISAPDASHLFRMRKLGSGFDPGRGCQKGGALSSAQSSKRPCHANPPHPVSDHAGWQATILHSSPTRAVGGRSMIAALRIHLRLRRAALGEVKLARCPQSDE